MKSKFCTKCGQEKDLNKFYVDKTHSHGVSSSCKKCVCVRAKKYHLTHKEEREKYNLKNKAKRRHRRKQYNLDHKEEIKKYNIKRAKQHKKWRQENKERLRILKKEYYLKNKTKIDNYRNKWSKHKRKTDIRYKTTGVLRHRINQAIRGNTKSLPTMMLIGCEVDYLLFHLQSQFTEGMSWDNYGGWEIDHIRPCASFDLSKPEEQIKCFNYKNLQPLWAKDNLTKSAKWNNNLKVGRKIS